MRVTAFSQRDSRWDTARLGTGEFTIGQSGCLLSAVAAMLQDCGAQIDPKRLNEYLKHNNGFVRGNLFVYSAVEPLGCHFIELIRCETTDAPIDRLSTALANNQHVIVQVDWQPGGRVQSHWLRLLTLGKQSGHVVDPWQMPGYEFTSLDHYLTSGWTPARGIFAAAIYDQVAPAMPEVETTLEVVEAVHQPTICVRR